MPNSFFIYSVNSMAYLFFRHLVGLENIEASEEFEGWIAKFDEAFEELEPTQELKDTYDAIRELVVDELSEGPYFENMSPDDFLAALKEFMLVAEAVVIMPEESTFYAMIEAAVRNIHA